MPTSETRLFLHSTLRIGYNYVLLMLKDTVTTKLLCLQRLNSNARDGMIIMRGQQVWISKINNDHFKALFLYLPMQTEETYQGNQDLICVPPKYISRALPLYLEL